MADPLLQPLQLRNLTLRNRIYSPAHSPAGFLVDGRPGERYALYHEEKAKGGLALTVIGGSSNVDLDSANVFDNFYAGDEEILPFYHDVSSRVHQHGAAIMVQLTHLGRRSQDSVGDQLPTISPSQVRERAHRSYPKEIEEHDIARVIGAFVRSAQLAKDGGLDGVEIAALAGHLIDQFWSRRTNRRTDRYGGTLENRMRFGIMVLQAVREAVGENFVVGIRLAGDEGARGGLEFAECVEIAAAISETRLVDYLSVIYGSGSTTRELSDIMPGFGRPLGAYVDLAGDIRSAVTVPVFHAGRIADLATARHAVKGGMVDMVGMVRAHIADPHLVSKLVDGHPERVRPCVGASLCLGSETQCVHNPATGREKTIPQLIARSDLARTVVVVGGGVAGLEAARVCAERGHSVTLLEASSQLGGQVLFATRPSRHAEKLEIVNWLAAEVKRLGVAIHLNCYAESNDVLGRKPDVAIVAAGGVANTQLAGVPDDLVVSCMDALGTRTVAGRRTLIYDDHGGQQALTTAEHLALSGEIVELVTADRMVGHDVVEILLPDYLRQFYSTGTTITPDHELVGVTPVEGGLSARLANVYTDQVIVRTIDRVVVEQGTLPVADLFEELCCGSSNLGELDLDAFRTGAPQSLQRNIDGQYQLFRIGDAVSHRGIHAAIYDARRLCMNL